MQEMNGTDCFISVAGDCPAATGEIPIARGGKVSAAMVHFNMAVEEPYSFTESQILFEADCAKKGEHPQNHPEGGDRWRAFFGKGQPCLRTSALGKRYGWGIHLDAAGKVAAFPADSPEYVAFANDDSLRQVAAMRSKRA